MVRKGQQLVKGKIDVITSLTDELPAGTQEIGTTVKDTVVTPSDNLQVSADNEQTIPSGTTSYTKKKEIKLNVRGTIRVKFDLKGNSVDTGYGRIYRNGVAVGTEQSETPSTWVTKSEDIDGWSRNDLLQLYVKGSAEGACGSTQNLRLYWDAVGAEVITN